MDGKKWFLSVLMVVIVVTAVIGCNNKNAQPDAKSYVETIKKRGKLVAGIKYDTFLFGYKDPRDGQVKGFEVDLMKELAKRLLGDEKKLQLKEVNSKTRVKLLQAGDIDLIAATMTITEKRKKEVDFSRVYFLAGQSLLVPAGSSITKVTDTAGKKVAAVKGAISGDNLKERVPSVKLDLYENYAEAFTALRTGKVAALTTDDTILMGMQQQNPGFKRIGPPFTQEQYGMAINKKNKDFTQYVNQFLADVMKDGTYAKVYKKWFKKEPPPELSKENVPPPPTTSSHLRLIFSS
jgi:aspartate/glutamate/glutamine transport system substrate-binding protein